MTIQELLESAQLDALGLLDEQDREAFERAFDAAPAPLQTQLRREQARLCRVDALLPQVDLPESLWPRVRDAVRQAQLTAASDAQATMLSAHAGMATHAGTDRTARPLPMARAAGVSRLWRAASIGFATAAVVLGAALVHLRATAERQTETSNENGVMNALVQGFGREFVQEMLTGPDTMKYAMTPAQEGRYRAAIWTDPRWPRAQLYCEVAATPGHTIRLVELDAAGAVVRELDEFESNGSMLQRQIRLEGVEPRQLALVSAVRGQSASTGTIVLRMA